MTIRWLHLSDVHECKRDGYHRTAMYEAIVAEVRSRIDNGHAPDLVFFTGDLAFAGIKDDYDLLEKRFLTPLRATLPDGCPIYTVPGNHDVNRKRAGNPRIWMIDEEQCAVFQKVDEEGGQKRVDMILPRFEEYRTLEAQFAAWGTDWLASEHGSVCVSREVNGHRLAIVGINTAWLCHDDEDWGRLTAGRTMVDAALKLAREAAPDLTIVLGHHPLEAMTGETEWSDGGRIRVRLEQTNAIYLHGHLHRSGRQVTGDSLQSTLAIQAPSGFQAADSNVWRNGVMWGEADLQSGRLIIDPKRWNNDFEEYVFDSDAAPGRFRVNGRDAFWFPLPGREVEQLGGICAGAGGTIEEPPAAPTIAGWEIIDAAELARLTATRPSVAEISDWFDGSFPSWEVAAADGVRPRRVVEDLVRHFDTAHHAAPLPMVRLLTGAGGEGKSAALLQTAAGLLRGAKNWTCLRRDTGTADLPETMAATLEPRPDHAWIVAIDDAENVAAGLPGLLRSLPGRNDVHMILAAREADWSLRGHTIAMWQGVADFRHVPIAGLDAEDARRIADGWAAYGPAAMGRLRDLSTERAAEALLGHAQELAASKEQGALLGALLIAREGEDLRTRVERLMAPWFDAPGIGKRSLIDIYAMIAAMHAENQLYLSHADLAFALGCEEVELERVPLRTLRREVKADSGTGYVLTRHRQIAEVARDSLLENGHDVDRYYAFLAVAAMQHSKLTRFEPNLSDWQFGLAKHFVERGPDRWPVARAIAKALFDHEPDNALLLTSYASTLRRTDQPGPALALFREHGPQFPGRRDVLCEWSVAAGAAGYHGLAVWLAARSLADDRSVPFQPNNIKLSLAGLGAAFRDLASETGRAEFTAAQAACGRLGLRLSDLDPTARGYLEGHSEVIPPPDPPPSIDADIATLRAAVISAADDVEPANDPVFFEQLIQAPDSYRYTMLARALSEDAGRRR